MEVSIFLAKWLGVYLLIVAALFIARKEQIEQLTDRLFNDPPLLAVTGFVSLMIGVGIVISHSIWEFNWQGLITLFGYLAILKGVIRIGYPEVAKSYAPKLVKGKGSWILLTLLIVIGLYLTYSGFTH